MSKNVERQISVEFDRRGIVKVRVGSESDGGSREVDMGQVEDFWRNECVKQTDKVKQLEADNERLRKELEKLESK